MKLADLLALLNDMKIGDLEKEVYIEGEKDTLIHDFELAPIVEDTESKESLGYVLSEKKDLKKEFEQLKLPFDEGDVH